MDVCAMIRTGSCQNVGRCPTAYALVCAVAPISGMPGIQTRRFRTGLSHEPHDTDRPPACPSPAPLADQIRPPLFPSRPPFQSRTHIGRAYCVKGGMFLPPPPSSPSYTVPKECGSDHHGGIAMSQWVLERYPLGQSVANTTWPSSTNHTFSSVNQSCIFVLA